MNNVYTGIELGTNSVKVVVVLKQNASYHVLASVNSKADGIRNGQIQDIKMAVSSVRRAMKQINDMLGFKVVKVIAAIPPSNCMMDIVVGSCDVIDYDCISGEDVRAVLKDALTGHIDEEYEVITASPISFRVDDQENIKDPKGMAGKVIEAKVVVSTLAKEPLYRILEALKLSGLETVDIAYSSTGDYFSIRNDKYDSEVGAIINIGELATNVSVFNRGIQIKNSLLPIGSFNVDKDLSYVFGISLDESRKVKESFAVAAAGYADANDVMSLNISDGSSKELSQVEVSKVVQARVEEILKLAKNEINTLTKREIRYIIVTGGLSELAGFQYEVENVLGLKAKVCNIPIMGVRHNKYSSALGVVKYFDDKLALRGKNLSMISDTDWNSLITANKKIATNNNIINKVFGHFFDN